jgi:hypothetical protein
MGAMRMSIGASLQQEAFEDRNERIKTFRDAVLERKEEFRVPGTNHQLDVSKIAKALEMKEGEVIDTYLEILLDIERRAKELKGYIKLHELQLKVPIIGKILQKQDEEIQRRLGLFDEP